MNGLHYLLHDLIFMFCQLSRKNSLQIIEAIILIVIVLFLNSFKHSGFELVIGDLLRSWRRTNKIRLWAAP